MKGQKTGGRSKGTPNRTQAQIREYYQQLLSENLDQLSIDIQSLEPLQRIKYLIELSKFVIPTLKAVEGSPKNEEFQNIVIRYEGVSKLG
jgi:hypothetical protein